MAVFAYSSPLRKTRRKNCVVAVSTAFLEYSIQHRGVQRSRCGESSMSPCVGIYAGSLELHVPSRHLVSDWR